MRAIGPAWMVRGDIDGFFGLFIDNLLQLMLIQVLCAHVCHFPAELINQTILPGAAMSILVGNLFYAWQARRLMRRSGRRDVTALPYGINTPSLLAYIFLIMGPVYQQTGNATLAWQAGLFACLLSGVMEIGGAFVGDWVRRHTPRAALLSALAGIAITFIAMAFVFQLFASPAIALLPMLLILFTYAGRLKLPLGLPGGLAAVGIGAALAWGWIGLEHLSPEHFQAPWRPAGDPYHLGLHWPRPVPQDLLALLVDPLGWRYLAVIFPMGLFNVIGSLQNLESAEAAGDRYETRSSLLVNGCGSLVAALFGSAFPTTIYIGHPGWKAMGARSAYSTLNGLVITVLCLIGGVSLVLRIVPIEATLGILLWIGIIITAQAFEAVPRRHALAVAVGLVPGIAAWALDLLIRPALQVGNVSLLQAVEPLQHSGLHLHGVIALSQGFLLTSMLLAAILACVIDQQFLRAAAWAAVTALLSLVGVIHAYQLTDQGVQNVFGLWAAPNFAVMYGLSALSLVALHCHTRRQKPTDLPTE